MKHFNRITAFMLSAALAASLSIAPASAMSYSVEGADGGFFGPITSIDSELEPADSASDYSKNAAYAPPGFGTPESYIPNRAEQLINLKGTDGNMDGVTIVGPGSIDGNATNSSITIVNGFPSVDRGPHFWFCEYQHLWHHDQRSHRVYPGNEQFLLFQWYSGDHFYPGYRCELRYL